MKVFRLDVQPEYFKENRYLRKIKGYRAVLFFGPRCAGFEGRRLYSTKSAAWRACKKLVAEDKA